MALTTQLIGTDVGSYQFSAAQKTITLYDVSLALRQVLFITNVNTNTVIYQFNKAGYGGTFAGLTLTLDYDTSAMADTDPLQILVAMPDPTLAAMAVNTTRIEALLCEILAELQTMNAGLAEEYHEPLFRRVPCLIS